MTAEACLFVASSSTRRRRQLLRGMLWPASARCNGASGLVCAPDSCRRDSFGRVHMHLEADLGRDAGALDQLAEASDCERCTPLGNAL